MAKSDKIHYVNKRMRIYQTERYIGGITYYLQFRVKRLWWYTWVDVGYTTDHYLKHAYFEYRMHNKGVNGDGTYSYDHLLSLMDYYIYLELKARYYKRIEKHKRGELKPMLN